MGGVTTLPFVSSCATIMGILARARDSLPNETKDNQNAAPPGDPPPGWKLLMWEGVGLYVPARWDIGKHQGDGLYGSYRVDGEDRPVVNVRWWKVGGQFIMRGVADQFRRHLVRERRGKPAGGAQKGKEEDQGPSAELTTAVVAPTTLVKLGMDLGDSAQAFAAGWAANAGREPRQITDVLICVHERKHHRAAVWQFNIRQGRPTFGEINRMAAGLVLQGLAGWRDWAVLDMRFRSPPNSRLEKAFLSTGACYLQFGWSGGCVGLRRFSAANAVMGRWEPQEEDLVRWCRGAYARDFHDMRYRIESAPVDDRLHRLLLVGKRRWLAPLELRHIIPKHRQPPREIEIHWDRQANKIYCLEIRKRTEQNRLAIQEMIDSYRTVFVAPAPQGRGEAAAANQGRRTPRQRSLQSRVLLSKEAEWELTDQGLVRVVQKVQRPAKLRLLRLLASMPAGASVEKRTVELDLIGSMIWQACKEKVRVCDLVELVRREFQISYREAESSVTEYVKVLGGRGLLGVQVPKA